jgi:hypothetical protein
MYYKGFLFSFVFRYCLFVLYLFVPLLGRSLEGTKKYRIILSWGNYETPRNIEKHWETY